MSQSMLDVRAAGKLARKQSPFRPDIQGLRAFAVIAVVLDHLLGWPHGGFIGVDVFFVISGFLITGHLLREQAKNGRISFVDFYRKRVKRIMPAAVLVLAVTVAVSYAVFNAGRFRDTLWDGVAGLLFASNWRFAAIGTDYFQADGPVTPLQHFWSLAVEEQFYFVWPWLLVLVFLVALRGDKANARRANLVAGSAIALVSTASLVWAVMETAGNPGLAYFSTFSRGWELGVGAGLACAVPLLSKIPDGVRPVLAWVGLVGLIASLFVISESIAFPAPAALLPVLAAASVIAAGTGSAPHPSLAVLTNRVSRYIGDISYSLYLWHFPVIIVCASLMPERGGAFFIVAATTMTLLSVFAYHLWEDPIRKSNWLNGKHSVRTRTDSVSLQFKVMSVALLAVLALGTAGLALMKATSPEPDAFTPPAVPLATAGQTAPALPPALTAVQADIRTALAQPSWPDLKPGVESLNTTEWGQQMLKTTCTDVRPDNLRSCYFPTPGATKTAVLYGDSYAMAWSPGLKKALSESGYNFQMLTRAQCPAANLSVTGNGGAPFPECDDHHAWATSQIASIQPDLLILASAENTLGRLSSKATGAAAVEEYRASMAETLKNVTPAADRTIVLSSPPMGQNLQTCITKVNKPKDCTTRVTGDWKAFTDGEKSAAQAAGAKYVDTQLWLCSDSGVCPAFVGNTPLRVDSGHLTIEYSTSLAPVMKEALAG